MQPETKLVNGRMITYKDVIHHDVTTVFSFMDRIRILFRGRCTASSELYTADEASVITSTATVYVYPIFKRKFKGQEFVSSMQDETGKTIPTNNQ